MLIKQMTVRHFRAIKDQLLSCSSLTALVGRNGSGKSSFLHAIDMFYDPAAPVSEEDFFAHDLDSPIEIQVSFGNLREEEYKEFRPYIKDNQLIVTKRISFENGRVIQRYYAAALQIPMFAEVRAISRKKDKITAWNSLVGSKELPDLGTKAKSADDVDRLMREYEEGHPDLLKPMEREEQFFGPKNIGGGKLDKFTKYVLVPAVREASDEASGKKGVIYQLLDTIVLRKVNARRDIQEFKEELEKKVKTIYSSENLRELPELGDAISATLATFAPGSKLNLKWEDVQTPEVKLPAARATLIEDNFEGDISRKGHGLQRALIVSLLQYLALIPKESAELTDQGEKLTATHSGPDLILALEEPELYLHPSRCRYLSELLMQLSEEPKEAGILRNQVIYATHSPYFVDLCRFDDIRIVRKINYDAGSIGESVVTTYSLAVAAKDLATICGENPETFTRNSFRCRAMSVVNTIVNEGFFADAVVVVEGQSEVGILWKVQELMGKDWTRLGICIVPAGGKNNIDRPVIIFRGFKIPTYFVFDGDISVKGNPKKEGDTRRRNHCYLRLANAPEQDFPNTQVQDKWAVFEDNLETALEKELGKEAFIAIREEVAAELGYTESSPVLKNIEGSTRFVEVVYSKGIRFPIIEEISEAITKLGA